MKLAEAVERRDGAGIDWYIENENDEPIVRLKELPGELADYYKKRLDADVAIISTAINEYEQRNDPAARSIASALKSAICHPSDQNLWLMGDANSGRAEIVITAWGYEPKASPLAANNVIHRREKVYPGAAQVLIDQPPPAGEAGTERAASPDRVVVRQKGWHGPLSAAFWVAAIILPFVIGWYLLPACGIKVPFTHSYIYGWGEGAFCPQLANPQMEASATQETALSADLTSVLQQVQTKIAQCVVTPPVEAAQPVSADEERIEAQGLKVDPNETSISLTWANTNDLDLYLICPDGQAVPLEGLRCGFKHEIDENRGSLKTNPVEYIRHQGEGLEPGTYKVQVVYFRNNPPSPVQTDFTVALRRNGIRREIHGTTSATAPIGGKKEKITITEFTVP